MRTGTRPAQIGTLGRALYHTLNCPEEDVKGERFLASTARTPLSRKDAVLGKLSVADMATIGACTIRRELLTSVDEAPAIR